MPRGSCLRKVGATWGDGEAEAAAVDGDEEASDDEQAEEEAEDVDNEERNKEQDEEVEETEETHHQGPEVRGGSSKPGLPNITSISISTGTDFVHPDAEGAALYTSPVSCDIFNALVRLMGKRGWTGLKQDWVCELLPLDEETDAQWTVRHGDILKPQHVGLLKKTLNLREICRIMPRAQNLHAQTSFLRENASLVQTTLTDVCTLVQEIEQEALQLAQRATKRHKASKGVNVKNLTERICKRLIPLAHVGTQGSAASGRVQDAICRTRHDQQPGQ